MKINKIICDICGIEIDIEVDEDMAIFERIRTQTKINLQSSLFLSENPLSMRTKKELVKSSFDLCKKCGSDTETFLAKKKEEYQNAKKVENKNSKLF